MPLITISITTYNSFERRNDKKLRKNAEMLKGDQRDY